MKISGDLGGPLRSASYGVRINNGSLWARRKPHRENGVHMQRNGNYTKDEFTTEFLADSLFYVETTKGGTRGG